MTADWHDFVYLRGTGFENYTGWLGGLDFVEGKSARKVIESEINLISANQAVVIIDEDGKEHPVGFSTRNAVETKASIAFHRNNIITLEEIQNGQNSKEAESGGADERSSTGTESESNSAAQGSGHGRTSSVSEQGVGTRQAADNSGLHDRLKIYSQEELVKMGDDKGIKGLRPIADSLGVKSTKLEGLIDLILKAQNEAQSGGDHVSATRPETNVSR